METDIQF